MTYSLRLTKYGNGTEETAIIVELDTLADAQEVMVESYENDLKRHPDASLVRNKFSHGMTVCFPERDETTEWVYIIEEVE